MNIGIMGTGHMAALMTDTIRTMKQNGESIDLYAVASRSAEKAERFSISTGVKKAYGSYEDMLRDRQVDFVYIATPVSEHYKNMLLCLNYRKPFLCEKAFTSNIDEAAHVLFMAEVMGVPAAEAIWTRYMPSRKIIRDVIDSGIIGIPRTLTANLSYNIYDNDRIHDANLAGGALLDVGVYPVNFAEMCFGHPSMINANAIITEDDVDECDTIRMEWPDGRTAALTCGTSSISDRMGVIYGDRGYITVTNINNPSAVNVYDMSRELIKTEEIPEQISGYEYEIREMMEAVANGDKECPSMPHSEILKVMRELDSIRLMTGLQFPFEA